MKKMLLLTSLFLVNYTAALPHVDTTKITEEILALGDHKLSDKEIIEFVAKKLNISHDEVTAALANFYAINATNCAE